MPHVTSQNTPPGRLRKWTTQRSGCATVAAVRRPPGPWRLLATAVAALAAAGCDLPGFGAPDPKAEEGESIFSLWQGFFLTAMAVGALVWGLLIFVIVRYRRRDDELPTQIHGNNKLELTWTVIPTVIVLFLFVVTIQAQDKVLDSPGDADVNVTVTAFQWSYRFTYEGTGAEVVGSPETIPEMVVPVGQRVRVKLLSADVVHTFYVPQTLFKRQAIPGTVNEFDLTFEKEGLYHGQCTQFCGLQHTDMTFRVRVVNQGQYQTWLAETTRRGSAGQPGT